jgi:SAM-dependent methyltransferase
MMDCTEIPGTGSERAAWNDRMFQKYPTPQAGALVWIIHNARHRTIKRFAAIQRDNSFFEIGCEAGHLLAALPEARCVVGGDISKHALDQAHVHLQRLGRQAHLLQIDADEALPFPSGVFDVIICSQMLEHAYRPRKVLENIYSLATPETRVVVSVPIEASKIFFKNLLHRMGLLKAFFPDIKEGLSEWHLHKFSPKLLRTLSSDLFEIRQSKIVLGCDYVVLLEKRQAVR